MGVPELVEDGVSGRLVPPAEVGALVRALQELADLGEDRRRRMGEAGRRVVEERFDADVEALRLAGLFERYRDASVREFHGPAHPRRALRRHAA